MMNALPPAHEVQQAVCVAIQALVCKTANILAVQEAVDPTDAPAGWLLDHLIRAVCARWGFLMDDTELHSRAASRRDWNCRASPPWTKKELGSWPSGSETRRAVMPRSRRFRERHCAACWPLPLASASKARYTVRGPSHSCRNCRALRWAPSEQVTL